MFISNLGYVSGNRAAFHSYTAHTPCTFTLLLRFYFLSNKIPFFFFFFLLSYCGISAYNVVSASSSFTSSRTKIGSRVYVRASRSFSTRLRSFPLICLHRNFIRAVRSCKQPPPVSVSTRSAELKTVTTTGQKIHFSFNHTRRLARVVSLQ